MHRWGDAWFKVHGDEIEAAVKYIATFCRRWGRLGGHAKEKFGTVRFYAQFHIQLHDLAYPGYARIQWGKVLQAVDYIYMYGVFDLIRSPIRKWQERVYVKSYLNALKKFPAIRKEILTCADHKELFPRAIEREANAGWSTLAAPGDVLEWTHPDGTIELVAYLCDYYNDTVIVQLSDLRLAVISRKSLKHLNGMGI